MHDSVFDRFVTTCPDYSGNSVQFAAICSRICPSFQKDRMKHSSLVWHASYIARINRRRSRRRPSSILWPSRILHTRTHWSILLILITKRIPLARPTGAIRWRRSMRIVEWGSQNRMTSLSMKGFVGYLPLPLPFPASASHHSSVPSPSLPAPLVLPQSPLARAIPGSSTENIETLGRGSKTMSFLLGSLGLGNVSFWDYLGWE